MIGLQVPEASLKATALAYYDYLRDFQQITVDVEYAALESQGQILNALVADAKASGVVRPKSGVFWIRTIIHLPLGMTRSKAATAAT